MEELFNNFKVNVDLDSTLNKEEFSEIIIDKISVILRKNFPNNNQKQRISKHHDRISFACPICDDSMSDHSKKRCNYITSGKYTNHVKCFNCGYFSSGNKFFKSFNVELDLSVINYIHDNIKNLQKNVEYEASFLFDTEYINNLAIDREEFKRFFRLYEINNTYAQTYLNSRQVYNTEFFLLDVKKNELVILNITDDKKIIGCQRRSFNKYSKNKYMTYKLSKLYSLMNKDSTLIPDDIDYLSTLFYVCIVDWSKAVTAFEGPIDAILFKNSIAMTGVSKSINIDLPMRYFLDNDDAGTKKSVELLENGNTVFLWSKFKNEYNLPKRKKWDLNDVVIYTRNNGIHIKNFNSFFSNSVYDLIDI